MNKVWLLAFFVSVLQMIVAQEDAQRWTVEKAHEAVKRKQVCDDEGDAAVWYDLIQYLELKNKSRANGLTLEEKNKRSKLKKALIDDKALAPHEEEENPEVVLLYSFGVKLLDQE